MIPIRTPILAALLLVGQDAIADDLAILELRFSNVPPGLTKQIRQRARSVLEENDYKVKRQDGIRARLRSAGLPPGCSMGPCLSRVGQALEVDQVLVGELSGEGTSYDIILTLLETGGGTPLAQVSDRCDVCNFTEVEFAVARAFKKLLEQSQVFLSKRARLTIQSNPIDAEVLLDGLLAGKTPLTRVLIPGPHSIQVNRKGFLSNKQQVRLQPGETSTVKVSLLHPDVTRIDKPSTRRSTSRIHPWIKWSVLGAGVLVAGIGGGLMALDGNDSSDPGHVNDTQVAGITLLSVGGAALITATLLSLLDGPRESAER